MGCCSKWVWVKKLLLIFVLFGNCSSTEGCWEQERVALLQLKHYSFNDPRILQNWVEEENSDCCQWERVACNNNTGRVIQLHLSSAIYWIFWRKWYMNASLFSSFEELEWLDLSRNNIAGCTENGGQMRLNNLKFLDLSHNNLENSIFSCLHGLSSLTTLYLCENLLNGTINVEEYRGLRMLNSLHLGVSLRPFHKINVSSLLESLWTPFPYLKTLELEGYTLGERISNQELLNFKNLEVLILDYSSLHISFLQVFTSLKHLSMRGCYLQGTSDLQVVELLNFKNLEVLILDYSSLHISFLQVFTSLKHLLMRGCYLHGTSDLQDFPKFRSLEKLDMDYSYGDISFLQISESSVSLKFLSLISCRLEGTILDQGLCEFVHLQELHMGDNYLRGTLPWCLANMTSLRVLDLSHNQITGNISSSPLRYLSSSIEELDVSHNQFQIPISLEPFFNHSKLKNYYAQENQLYTELGSHSMTPKFQLNSISLSGCRYDGTFPKFLHYQHELRDVDLSHINLRGEFPSWLLQNNLKLKTLLLTNNSLSGTFQMPVNPHKQLTVIDVSSNSIQGQIPTEIGAFFPRLEDLNISKNAFNGSIPSSFGDISSLKSLDISYNQLTGKIPEHMAVGCFSLQILTLSNNSLQGHIFPRNFNLTNLFWLQLDANQFTGGIPKSLSNCSLLVGLYLSDNHISGQIPSWLGNFSNLEDFIMPNNHLQGPIPASLCELNSIFVLDLEGNNISGSLPSCFSRLSISQVHLSRNMIEGKLEDVPLSSYLVTLDLSHNRLNGRIPKWIGRLSFLNYLILAGNNLEGEVSVQLCLLNKLQLLDLSYNNLSGNIPSCLDQTALKEGNSDAPGPVADYSSSPSGSPMRKQESVPFTTKNVSYYYQGRILTDMFGLDLSCNKLTGEIPLQIGYLSMIRALNLSHNNLTGTIPTTFSHLNQIESLDLSYNTLQGEIPPQLIVLNALAVFSVAHNNLSGKIPDRVAQFGTFSEDIYSGNPFLCGLPLPKSCNENESPRQAIPNALGIEEDENLIDMQSFYITFAPSYAIVMLGIIGVLYVNPYWRRRWFYLVENCIASCYYFCVDHLIPTRLRCFL